MALKGSAKRNRSIRSFGNRLKGEALGRYQLAKWHEQCDRKRRKNRAMNPKLCAPEHLKRGCSWKFDRILSCITVKRKHAPYVIEFRGSGFYGCGFPYPTDGEVVEKKYE